MNFQPIANVVLIAPEIPQNTGNLIRLCANVGARLHLVEPLGFQLENAGLRRASLDYRDLTDIRVHDSVNEFFQTISIGSVYGCDDKPFLQAMVNAGALNYLDCVGMHYNEGLLPPSATSGDPRGSSGHYTRYFKGMLDTYNAILGGAKPICITELGYLSGEEWGYLPAAFSWNPPINMTVAQHADYLGQAVTLARQQGTIRVMIIFNVDFAVLKNLEDDPQAGYSIIRPDQSCPACQTLAAAMQ